MRNYIEQDHPHIELFNSKFTKHCSHWGLRFVSLGFDLNLTRNTPNALIRRLELSGRDLYRIEHFIDKLKEFPNVEQVAARETFFDSYKQANRFLDMMKTLPRLKSLELDYYMLDLFWKIRDRILILYPQFREINGYNIRFTQPNELDLKLDRIVENTWRGCNWFSFQVPETDVTVYSLDPKTLAKRGTISPPTNPSPLDPVSHRLLFERRAGQLHPQRPPRERQTGARDSLPRVHPAGHGHFVHGPVSGQRRQAGRGSRAVDCRLPERDRGARQDFIEQYNFRGARHQQKSRLSGPNIPEIPHISAQNGGQPARSPSRSHQEQNRQFTTRKIR